MQADRFSKSFFEKSLFSFKKVIDLLQFFIALSLLTGQNMTRENNLYYCALFCRQQDLGGNNTKKNITY